MEERVLKRSPVTRRARRHCCFSHGQQGKCNRNEIIICALIGEIDTDRNDTPPELQNKTPAQLRMCLVRCWCQTSVFSVWDCCTTGWESQKSKQLDERKRQQNQQSWAPEMAYFDADRQRDIVGVRGEQSENGRLRWEQNKTQAKFHGNWQPNY